MLDIIHQASAALLLILFVRKVIAASFYRAYFNRKQRALGKDPNEVLKKEFGAVRSVLIFWPQ